MKSIRDVYKIGKGPSSSHTMGPERAARLFLERYPDADRYCVKLYESLSKTGRGHGTDRVLYEVLAKAHTEEQFCAWRYISLSEYVELNEGPEIWDFLSEIWRAMKRSVEIGLHTDGVLPGGLNVQRKAKHLFEQESDHELPQVRELRLVCSYAFAVAEENADNGTIVTAPTCGACGVLPAVLKYAQETKGFSDEKICRALATAGIIGNLTKQNASISGAECGCQAEIGTACSMAAAALAYLYDQNMDPVEYAAEVAMEHHLGLTCDPICGLVQIPCIERNAVAAMRAMNACNLSYFLTGSRNISYDMVCRAMKETGENLNHRFRETSEGGLAKLYNRRGR